MQPKKECAYWDSDCFISRIQQQAGRIETLRQITDAAEAGKVLIVTSAFTLVEVAKFKDSDLSPAEQEQLIVDFFENPYIVIRQVDRIVSTMAREIIRNHKVKGKDAVHVATAARHGIKIMHTYDGGLHKLSGLIGTPALKIEAPIWAGGQTAFNY